MSQVLDPLSFVLSEISKNDPDRVEVWVDPLDEDSDDDAYMTRVVFRYLNDEYEYREFSDVYLLGHDQTYEEARVLSIAVYDAIKVIKDRGVSRSIKA